MYDRLRPLSYAQTSVFLLIYSITDPKSLEQIQDKWVPEMKHHCPKVPFILVANKQDVRADDGSVISTAEGQQMAKKIGAACYVCNCWV